MLRRSRETPSNQPTEIDANAHQHLDLARTLAEEAESLSKHLGPDGIIDHFVKTVPNQLVTERGRQAFDALLPQQQLEALQRLGNDDVLNDALLERRAATLDTARAQARLAALRETALRDNSVDLSKLPLGAPYEIGLYQPSADSSTSRYASLVRNIRLAHIGDSKMRVIEDVYDPHDTARSLPNIYTRADWQPSAQPSGAVVILGSQLTFGNERIFDTTLYEGAKVDIQTAPQPEAILQTGLVLGSLAINGYDLFDESESASRFFA